MLRPHPGNVLGQFAELAPQSIRVGPEGSERALQAEEGLDLLPQQ
jgi:hypothetical protein